MVAQQVIAQFQVENSTWLWHGRLARPWESALHPPRPGKPAVPRLLWEPQPVTEPLLGAAFFLFNRKSKI